ncbi:MAG: ATP-dependent Clp protease ATP-binding subunit ClpX [Parcubacteria group bacterium GW2011_GWC2_45_7]|nr:MAG: ATP-dependent Clp protease ATP-binding subunit ClpX [Parcubacteria group bacterium GW2011_GWC2_45_7]KKU73125.1 MAG: ATP-dependent Clp protease ATP-binding subunit ClpX [Parcubacteria group bacterium GW2011_GWA2_47_26]
MLFCDKNSHRRKEGPMDIRKRWVRGRDRCSFCGKSADEVRRLVAGPNSFICDSCVVMCKDLLERDEIAEIRAGRRLALVPRRIRAVLDSYVIGHDRAKKALAVAAFNHLKRISYHGTEVEMGKGNVILMGPTGCGKTYLAQVLARAMGVPVALVDATPITRAGYVGEDVESILMRLLQAAGHDIEKAERGIVFLDEADKLARRTGRDRDVGGEGVQQSLLRMLEGSLVAVPRRSSSGEDRVMFDTRQVLFIAGGAFDGLSNIVADRLQSARAGFCGGRQLGVGEGSLHETMPEDLYKFGMIPEFVGRFPVLIAVDALGEEDLARVLAEPRNALLKQYARQFALDDMTLSATPEGLRAIARRALALGTGARGLRTIMEELLLDPGFECRSGSTYLLDEKAVATGSARLVLPKLATG